ncbi:MAG: hypothetical protein JW913_19510 [Chitinispirillaceae bacterium]|nr:hypothetical protein [Chitinispirillaceae bacterium]
MCCVKKVREGLKNWKHNSTAVKRFLTDFGYTKTDPAWVEITPAAITAERVNPAGPSNTILFNPLASVAPAIDDSIFFTCRI